MLRVWGAGSAVLPPLHFGLCGDDSWGEESFREMPERVGIMGGTFDPVHIGHLRAAEETVEALNLDALFFMPAADPPHKTGKKIQPFKHRWRMLQLSLEGHPRFHISDLERRLPGKSYSVITLRKLREEVLPGAELFFLVGLDAFLELDTWWHYKELFQLAHIVALRRPGYSGTEIAGFLKRKISDLYTLNAETAQFDHPQLYPVHYLHNTHLEISSTRIRHLVKEGRSIRYLVLPEVMSYIMTKKLYHLESLIIS